MKVWPDFKFNLEKATSYVRGGWPYKIFVFSAVEEAVINFIGHALLVQHKDAFGQKWQQTLYPYSELILATNITI